MQGQLEAMIFFFFFGELHDFWEKIVKREPFFMTNVLDAITCFSYHFLGQKIVAPLTFLAPGPPFCKAITANT